MTVLWVQQTNNMHVVDCWRLHYANDVESHRSMQRIGHCTGRFTKLYLMRVCCTVCKTHAECLCEAIVEWVMLEADLWNADCLSSTICFPSIRALRCHQSPAGFPFQCKCRQERPALGFKRTAKFRLQVRDAVYICNAWFCEYESRY